jgi:branched-subunit amino acid ABC-type transport system permease component
VRIGLILPADRALRLGAALVGARLGLTVTLALMNVVNLAHGVFVMAGGSSPPC